LYVDLDDSFFIIPRSSYIFYEKKEKKKSYQTQPTDNLYISMFIFFYCLSEKAKDTIFILSLDN